MPDPIIFARGLSRRFGDFTAVDAVDISVQPDQLARGRTIIEVAKKMGVTDFVHYSFPRHMSQELLARRRDIMIRECAKRGLQFHFVTAPDPTGEAGLPGTQQFIFEDLPIEEFNSGGVAGASGATAGTGAGDELQIERQGDTFVVTGLLDLSSSLSGVTGPFGGTGGAQFFESADIKIAITFPGEVLEAPGGEIDGNTVTYLPKFGERLEINATGSAVDNGEAADVAGGGDSFLPLLLIIAGVVLVLLLVILLVVRSRRNKVGGGTPSGFGEAGSAAQPVAAPPGGPTDAAPPGARTEAPPPAPPMPPAPPPPPEG